MYRNILLPIDIDALGTARRCLKPAVEMARLNKDTRVHLLAVLPGFNMPIVSNYFDQSLMDKAREEAEQIMEAFVKEDVPDDIQVVTHISIGAPFKRILKEINLLRADLVIMSANSSERKDRFFLGHVSSKLAEHSPASVMIIKD